MNDREYLTWLYKRLTDVHGENPLVDYMHKLRSVIKATDAKQNSPSFMESKEAPTMNDTMKVGEAIKNLAGMRPIDIAMAIGPPCTMSEAIPGICESLARAKSIIHSVEELPTMCCGNEVWSNSRCPTCGDRY